MGLPLCETQSTNILRSIVSRKLFFTILALETVICIYLMRLKTTRHELSEIINDTTWILLFAIHEMPPSLELLPRKDPWEVDCEIQQVVKRRAFSGHFFLEQFLDIFL